MITNSVPVVLLSTVCVFTHGATCVADQHHSPGHDTDGPAVVNHQHALHQGDSTTAPSRKSERHRVAGLQIETVITQSGLRVLVFDGKGQPIDTRGARGVAILTVHGESKRYRYDLFADASRNQSSSSLRAAVDLSRFAGRKVSIDFRFVGLPQSSKRGVVLSHASSIPMNQAQIIAARIAEQRLCPVSKQLLGSMGTPIAVELGSKTVFVCCEGCIKSLRNRDPGSNPRAVPDPVAVTKADAAAIAAQRICPVMDEPLHAMGGPWKTVVEGRTIYVCCPGCAKRLHAKPKVFLAKLSKQGVIPPETQGDIVAE